MSNKKKHSDSLLDRLVVPEDEQSYNEYIGSGGEAHHPPPSAKKPRLGSLSDQPNDPETTVVPPSTTTTDNRAAAPSEDEPPEPKSIDVFGSQPKTDEAVDSQEGYSTPPEEFDEAAEGSRKSPEKLAQNPEVSAKNGEEEEEVDDSQKNSEDSAHHLQKSESFSDDGSEEIGEKFDSIISGEVEEEEEEELKIHVKMNDSKGSDSSDDRMMEEMREEREMMNTGKKEKTSLSRPPSPDVFSSNTDGSVGNGQHHSSDFQSPPKLEEEQEESMEVEEERAQAAGNKTMDQMEEQQKQEEEEEDDLDALFGGPDQNLEQEEDEEEEGQLNAYERKLHQGSDKNKEKEVKKESTAEDIQRVSLTSKPISKPKKAERMDDGLVPDDDDDDVFDDEEAEPRIPTHREVDRQCTTDLAFLKEEQFEKRKLQFQPDFNAPNFDGTEHYRYCDIPGLPKPDSYLLNWSMIDQDQWRPRNKRGIPNECYGRKRLILERYLQENRYAEQRRDGGYLMFVHVIQEMWHDPYSYYTTRRDEWLELPALWNYFRMVSSQKGYLYVANQFANLVRIALSAEHVLPKKIYTFRGPVHSATLSHEQCAALVARMFFNGSDDYRVPNFKRILKSRTRLAVQKLHFLFAYFDKIGDACPQGCVSFRLVDEDKKFSDHWKARKETPPTDVRIYTDMFIEETALCTQVDFANEYLGGGVLDRGSVQEEIRFLQCPEMFVGMMLMNNQAMTSNQAISIVGAYVYSSYEGYAETLKWKPLKDGLHHARQNHPSLRDAYGRLRVETIAIDATRFERPNALEQYSSKLTREMKKASVGFMAQNEDFDQIPIVSGFWGCGAFNGHKPLKFVQQVIAAGTANRPLIFCTFGEHAMAKKCEEFMANVRKHELKLCHLNHMLRAVQAYIDEPHRVHRVRSPTFFFDFCTNYLSNPDHVAAMKARSAASTTSSLSSQISR